ncbi:class I SAM-dependent methyltransferase [Aquariibacter albus]|uniref:Class I SAM-dependent methyltransferase n=1 Tax=Aquariibacter albus TaxID=2759899 RepID=A0A839HI64_9BURK|nr:class I SAM-dependent methyltransferase [Aquariibacter albus]MBB1161533.1 class I SAM-dependent methyltransferase [Aquariibacter albus]
MDPKQHWEQVYGGKAADAVSWFEPHAATSLALIEQAAPGGSARIIDVGGGASTLVDDLLLAGYRDVTVVDLSAAALAAAQARLGPVARRVHWLVGDILSMDLPGPPYDLWHDRAVFHFLVEEAARRAYVAQVLRAVRPGGHVIVATFGAQGPTQCSGLPVKRYDADALHDEFGRAFDLVEHREHEHRTPGGVVQQFVYCYCRKVLT